MKRIPRRIFTEEFKREEIKLVTEQLNIAAAGRQLDVDPKSIRACMGHAKRGELKATLGANKLTADQQRKNNTLPMRANNLLKSITSGSRSKKPAHCGSEWLS